MPSIPTVVQKPTVVLRFDHAQAFNSTATDKQLDLGSNLLTGSLPDAWGNASLVQSFAQLNLSSNHLSGTIPESYSALLGIRQLMLAANNLEGPLPASWLSAASGPASLEAVHLGSNPCLCGSTPSWFSGGNANISGTGLGTACVTGATCPANLPPALTTPDSQGEGASIPARELHCVRRC